MFIRGLTHSLLLRRTLSLHSVSLWLADYNLKIVFANLELESCSICAYLLHLGVCVLRYTIHITQYEVFRAPNSLTQQRDGDLINS